MDRFEIQNFIVFLFFTITLSIPEVNYKTRKAGQT